MAPKTLHFFQLPSGVRIQSLIKAYEFRLKNSEFIKTLQKTSLNLTPPEPKVVDKPDFWTGANWNWFSWCKGERLPDKARVALVNEFLDFPKNNSNKAQMNFKKFANKTK